MMKYVLLFAVILITFPLAGQSFATEQVQLPVGHSTTVRLTDGSTEAIDHPIAKADFQGEDLVIDLEHLRTDSGEAYVNLILRLKSGDELPFSCNAHIQFIFEDFTLLRVDLDPEACGAKDRKAPIYFNDRSNAQSDGRDSLNVAYNLLTTRPLDAMYIWDPLEGRPEMRGYIYDPFFPWVFVDMNEYMTRQTKAKSAP